MQGYGLKKNHAVPTMTYHDRKKLYYNYLNFNPAIWNEITITSGDLPKFRNIR